MVRARIAELRSLRRLGGERLEAGHAGKLRQLLGEKPPGRPVVAPERLQDLRDPGDGRAPGRHLLRRVAETTPGHLETDELAVLASG